MILVRTVFHAKWNKAGEFAQQMAESTTRMAGAAGTSGSGRVLTDLSGRFHTVVLEVVVPSLAEWEKQRAEMFASQEFQQDSAISNDLIESGYQEFYTVEAEF